ncbi:MAG: thiol reductase thioredoxin [Bacteroidetes bacterium HGW-Bacteroidetes-1]|jgi:thioredoxin|nr:MAG: thiol reductase thioredoxin [Bacteroidetes bacterium HGW-Bacteroidetes-1]
MIRKTLTFTLALFILTTGCSNITGKQAEDNTSSKVTDESSKIEYLTYDTFIKKVWNFENNPDNWVYEGEIPAVIDFYADWCAPCRRIAPIMEKLAKDYDGRIKIYKIDVDKEQKLAGVFQVRSIPAVLFTPKSGQPMMQAGAMTEEMYVKIIEEQLLKK